MYSATTGKDWGTGRELDTTERGLRAGFALFDLIPGVGYINDLAKSGSKVAAKEFIQTSIQKGMAQGAKNLDSFKQVLKHVKGFGDTILTNMDTYAKQLDTLVKSKVSSLADNLAGKLHHADGAISEAARNFRLNVRLEPQLVDGVMSSSSPGRLSDLADKLQAFAKSLDGGVDDVVGRIELANKLHPVTGVPFDSKGFPIFDTVADMKLSPDDYLKSRGTHFDRASKDLYNQIINNPDLAAKFTKEEIEVFKNGGIPKRFTWHHHQEPGLMQLVDRRIHRATGHIGGYSIWGKGN